MQGYHNFHSLGSLRQCRIYVVNRRTVLAILEEDHLLAGEVDPDDGSTL